MSCCNRPMVQQVIDKFNEYSSIHSGSAMPAGDKQHPVSVKKVTLWELPNTSDDIMSKPSGNSLLDKERGPMMDSVTKFGTKRQQPDCPSSPSSHQPHVNKGINGHLVYVRRKFETERGKKNTSNNVDSLSSSVFSRKPNNEETKEPNVQQDKTQQCNKISCSREKAVNGVERIDIDVTATADIPVDPERPNNLNFRAPVPTRRLSNQESNASVHLQRPSSQDCKAPVDAQRLSNQDPNASVDLQRPSSQDCKAPVDPQRSNNQDLNAPVDPRRLSDQDSKAPVDPQRPSNQDYKDPVDPQRLKIQDCKAPVDPQRPNGKAPIDSQRLNGKAPVDPQRPKNQDSTAAVNPQRPNNQESKAPVDPQKPNNQYSQVDPQSPSNQAWKERYLQLQVFLKNCDQSSQENYKRMLRSLTAADRSRHAVELEKRALNLLLQEGKELHRMQVLNIIGEATLQDHASPPTQTSTSQFQPQRMETMLNPKSPFLRNDY